MSKEGQGLPIETMKPYIEHAHEVNDVHIVNHAELVKGAKIVNHSESTTAIGDSFIGKATVSYLNIEEAHGRIKSGWSYKLTDSGTLNKGNVPVKKDYVVIFNNGVWVVLSTNIVIPDRPSTAQSGDVFVLKSTDSGLVWDIVQTM